MKNSNILVVFLILLTNLTNQSRANNDSTVTSFLQERILIKNFNVAKKSKEVEKKLYVLLTPQKQQVNAADWYQEKNQIAIPMQLPLAAKQTMLEKFIPTRKDILPLSCLFLAGIAQSLGDAIVTHNPYPDGFWGLNNWDNDKEKSFGERHLWPYLNDGYHLATAGGRLFIAFSLGATVSLNWGDIKKKDWKNVIGTITKSLAAYQLGYVLGYNFLFKK